VVLYDGYCMRVYPYDFYAYLSCRRLILFMRIGKIKLAYAQIENGVLTLNS
jgi:hypothetical protein